LIQREVVLDIEHCLMARPGTTLDDVKVVYSIPVATAQCHAFLRKPRRARGAARVELDCGGGAAGGGGARCGRGRVAPRIAAEIYGLDDRRRRHRGPPRQPDAVRRRRREPCPPRTGHDRTGLVIYQRADEPGSLISILQEFAARGST
jgi:prephenate dehydratase